MLNVKIDAERVLLSGGKTRTFIDRFGKSSYPSVGIRVPESRKRAVSFKESSCEETTDYCPETFEGVMRRLMVWEIVDFDCFIAVWDKQVLKKYEKRQRNFFAAFSQVETRFVLRFRDFF